MGEIVSYDTYLSVHELTCWNNDLYASGIYLCKKKLKNQTETDNWQDKILIQINKDQANHQNLLQIVKDYFSLIFNKKKDIKYVSPRCNLNEISK